jgi:hypothetical protein
VNLHAGAGGVGFLVLAGDAILLGNRHVGGCMCVWCCGGGVGLWVIFVGGRLVASRDWI